MLVGLPQHSNQLHISPQKIHAKVKVLETFTFTGSQGMEVSLDWLIDDESLPSVAFLKLHDRRYLDERMEMDAKEPCSPEKEAASEKYAQTLINNVGGPTSLTIAWNSDR